MLPADRLAVVLQFLNLSLPGRFLDSVIWNVEIGTGNRQVDPKRVLWGEMPIEAGVQATRSPMIVKVPDVHGIEVAMRSVAEAGYEEAEVLSSSAAYRSAHGSLTEVSESPRQTSVQGFIYTRAGEHGNNRSGSASELGGKVSGQNVHGPDCVSVEGPGRHHVDPVCDRDPIDYIEDTVIDPPYVNESVVLGHHARGRRHQIEKLATPVHARLPLHKTLVEFGFSPAGVFFEGRFGGLHLNRGACARDLQSYVHDYGQAGSNPEVLDRWVEAQAVNAKGVPVEGNIAKGKRSGTVGPRNPCKPRGGILEPCLGCGDRGRAWIRHHPRNSANPKLGLPRFWGQQRDHEGKEISDAPRSC